MLATTVETVTAPSIEDRTPKEVAADRQLAARLRIAAAALLAMVEEVDPHIGDQLAAIAADVDRGGEILYVLSMG
jgi:hypothetical protein